jgi:hypothetical protein
MTDKKVTKIVLWYSREWKSWGVIKYNKDGDQIGEVVWVYTKQEAINQKKEFEQEYHLNRRR